MARTRPWTSTSAAPAGPRWSRTRRSWTDARLLDDRGPGVGLLGGVGGAGESLRGRTDRGAVPFRPLRLGDGPDGARLARCMDHDLGAGRGHIHAPARRPRLPGYLPAPVGGGEE